MEKRGVDQSALARDLGVAQGTISKIIVGRTANSRLLPRIASRLGVSVTWLLGETDDPEADAASQPQLSYDQLELIDCYDRLDNAEKAALLQMARVMAGKASPAKPDRLHSPPVGFRPGPARSTNKN